jgi:hypothetical protein
MSDVFISVLPGAITQIGDLALKLALRTKREQRKMHMPARILYDCSIFNQI